MTIYIIINISQTCLTRYILFLLFSLQENELKAVLHFEPGLYTHIQMKHIRDEYLKLPGIKFGWVLGKKAAEVSTVILNFEKNFLRRVPLRKYTHWKHLNRRYKANITILEEGESRAYIRFPQGIHSDDLKLKSILRNYRNLPGISSVEVRKFFDSLDSTKNDKSFDYVIYSINVLDSEFSLIIN